MGLIIQAGSVAKRGELLKVNGLVLGEDDEGHMTLSPPFALSDGGGTASAANSICVEVAMHATSSSSFEILNIPSSLTDVSTRGHQWFSAVAFERVRLVANVISPATAGTLIVGQYSIDQGATWSFFDGASGPALAISTSGTLRGAWLTLAPDARTDVEIRWCTYGGNGTTSPTLGKLALEFLTPGVTNDLGDGGDGGTSLPGAPLAWHRADQWAGPGVDPSLTDYWTDLTGNGNHLTLLSGTRPGAGDPLNSIDTLRFNGGIYSWPTTLYQGATAGEGFVVYRSNGGGGVTTSDDFGGGTSGDVDTRAFPIGGATWKKLGVEPGSQDPLPHARFEILSGDAVYRYGDGTHVESEGTADTADQDANLTLFGLYAPYVFDGPTYGTDQGIEVTLRRKFRPDVDSGTTYGGIDLELLLCQDPNNTFGMFGAGGSRGCYALSLYCEDYHAAGGAQSTDDSPDFYPFGWMEIDYNWSSTDPVDHAFTATADLLARDGVHSSGTLAAPGCIPLPPVGATSLSEFKMRFEKVGSVLSGYIDDVLYVSWDIASQTMLEGQYISSFSFHTMPTLTDGIPGIAFNDVDSDIAIVSVRAYSLSGGGGGGGNPLWRLGTAGSATDLGDTSSENFGSTTVHTATTTQGATFHLWNPRSAIGQFRASFDAVDVVTDTGNIVGFTATPLFGGGDPGLPADADVAEVILYGRQLTETERDQVTAALSARWDLGLPTVLTPGGTGGSTGTPPPPPDPIVGQRSMLLCNYSQRYWYNYEPFDGQSIPVNGITVTGTEIDDLYAALNTARAGNMRILPYLVSRFAYSPRTQQGDKSLDIGNALAMIAAYEGADVQEWVDDGTLLGFMIMDEPFCAACYGGQIVPPATVDDFARRHKAIFPGVRTYIRVDAMKMKANQPSGGWKYVDGAWCQYPGPLRVSRAIESAPGDTIQAFISGNLDAAQSQGLRIIWAFNPSNSGDGSSGIPGTLSGGWRMTPAEVLRDALPMAKQTYSDGLVAWAGSNPPDTILLASDMKDALNKVKAALIATP